MSQLIVIVGETASGKSSLALRLAKRHNGEIIAADSRTLYRGMDIGTAKPAFQEQAEIAHHLIDNILPDEVFTAADFQKKARVAIIDIQSRGKIPIMVGGTGLYVDSILYSFTFRVVNQGRRKLLERLSVSELQQLIAKRGLELPQDSQNPRHLVRVLESGGELGKRQPLRPHTLVLGIQVPVDVLQQRIEQRVEQMFRQGLEQEVRELAALYAWDTPGLSAIGYREFKLYFEGQQTLEQTKQQIIVHTRQYAKRQRTWFKRNTDIRWFATSAEAEQAAEAFLTTKNTP